MYFFAYRQENLGPYFKLLGILKIENVVKLKIVTLSVKSETKATIFHTCSLNFFYQYPTYTPTIQDMQPKIIGHLH